MTMLIVILKSGEAIKIRLNDDEVIIFTSDNRPMPTKSGEYNQMVVSVGIAKADRIDRELAHFNVSCLTGYYIDSCDEEESKKEPDG